MQDCGENIRNVIVANMNMINFPPNSLQTVIHSDDFPNQHRILTCASVDEYLRVSKMGENGVFGTCVEIYTFCQVFSVDVYLYHVPLKSWLIYECCLNTDRRGIFIQQTRSANHFEVVNELFSIRIDEIVCPPRTSMVNSSLEFSSRICAAETQLLRALQGTAEEPATKKTKLSTTDANTFETHSPMPEVSSPHISVTATCNYNPPFSPSSTEGRKKMTGNHSPEWMNLHNSASSVSGTDKSNRETHDKSSVPDNIDYCQKCMRKPTLHHPFKLVSKKKSELKNRMFGNRLRESLVYLCNLCLCYCTFERIDWNEAWPSVFFTLLSDIKLTRETQINILAILPVEIRQQWLGSIGCFSSSVQQYLNKSRIQGKCAVDGTLRLRRFQQLLKGLEQESIALALDEEPYPNVRCPFGCWCFIEEVGFIAAKHFLNLFYPEFTSFQASSHLHLRGMRSDFLVPTLSLRRFLVAATLRVDKSEGLIVHACSMHSKGSSVHYIHPPSHPSLTRTALLHEERLSVVAPTISWITNIKANFASHTYQLLKSIGSYSGISTVRLKRKTRWDITSDILYQAEGISCCFRDDIKTLIRQWVRDGKIVDDIASGMLQYQPQMANVTSCLLHSSSTDLETCVEVAKIVDKCEKQYLNYVEALSCYSFAQGTDDFGCSPPPLNNNCNNVLWLVQAATCLSPLMCRLLVNSPKYPVTLKPLFCLLRNVFISPTTMRNANSTILLRRSEESIKKLLQQCQSEDEASTSAQCCCVLGAKFLEMCCDSIRHIPLLERKAITCASNLEFPDVTTHAIFTTTSVNNLRNRNEPPLSFVVSGQEYELIAMGSKDAGPKNEPRWLVRHGKDFQRFWIIEKNSKFARKTDGNPTEAIQSAFRGYWTIAIFEKTRNVDLADLKWQFLSTLTGQGVFICQKHDLPLTRDFRKSTFRCRCGLCSFLRCPYFQCHSCICKSHFKEGLKETNKRVLINAAPCPKEEIMELSSESDSSVSTNPRSGPKRFCNMPFFESTDPEVAAETIDFVTSSNSSLIDELLPGKNDDDFIDENLKYMGKVKPCQDSKALSVQRSCKEENFKLPLHILLNSQCNLLYRRKGNPISLTLKEKRFVENIAAISTSSLPLVQPEALLFPSIFWSQSKNGSFHGAIPAALYNSSKYNKQLGFAGLEDMLRTRIKDGSLLTSCNAAYLQYVFDCLLNTQLHKTDVRIVLNRGWQEVSSAPSNSRFVSTETFKFDCAESRKNVCELAALIREKNPTYFVTYTCGQSTHPGIRKIFEALHELYPEDTTAKEVLSAAIQAELMPMLRCWYRASQYVMEWIKKSPERPLGPVSHIWMRYEWQEETAGFPHLHAILCTPEDKFSNDVRSRICCSKETFLGALEISCPTLTKGDRLMLADLFQKYQVHNCTKGRKRCHKKTDRLNQPICRVPKYPASQCFSFKEVPINFSAETWDLLQELGLADIDENTLTPKAKAPLVGGKHHYPTVSNEHFSPTNAALFALTQSSTNVQICDDYMAPRYAAKYAAGIESRAAANILAGEAEDSVKVLTQPLENEKIAGVQATINKKLRDYEKQNAITGRIVSITECLWWCLQLPYVCTNVDFVHVPTVPKEYRSGIVKEKHNNKLKFSTTFDEAVRVRRQVLQLPKYRQFTESQVLLLADVETSFVTPDKVTLFGLRPPELNFISTLSVYYSWFVRCKSQIERVKSNHELFVKKNIRKTFWVDATGYVIKLRPAAVESFINVCRLKGSNERNEKLKNEMRKNVVPVLRSRNNSQFVAHWKSLSNETAVVVYSNILPNNPTKFLLHLLLTLGDFITEIDILNVQSFKDAFVAANVVPSCVNEMTVKTVTRKYLLEQLRFTPGSSKLIEKYLLMAHGVLSEALLRNNLYFAAALPPALDIKVMEESDEALTLQLVLEKSKMVAFLHTCQTQLPNEQTMLDSTVNAPVPWKPKIQKSPDQCKNSYLEQCRTLDRLMLSIDKYKRRLCFFIRHQVVFGPPGSGKTFVMLKSLAYALCQGLHCVVTSLAAERSAALAGRHLNALIPFPVEKSSSAESLAKTALSNLQRSPVKTRFLQNVDVFFIEEMSMISSEIWAATDHVLQVITSNYVPFGGKLVIATGDFFQLPPPSGSYLMSSSFPLTTFAFHNLKNFVRMQNKNGQELLSLMSSVPKTDANAKRIWEIIEKSCNFVESWSDVPSDSIRIFATRQAERKATENKITDVKNSGTQYYEHMAVDEMCLSSTENWTEASTTTSNFLNKKCLEPGSLFLYPGAILRLTVNKPSIQAYQGQLCVLVSMDSIENGSVTVALAPAGCRTIPPLSVMTNTWRCVVINKEIGVQYVAESSSL